MMNRKKLFKFIPICGIVVAFIIAGIGINQKIGDVMAYEWRLFALPVILSLVSVMWMLYLLLKRVSSIRGALYWFGLLMAATIGWLVVTLLQVLSANAETAAFWQGMLPMAWMPLPIFLFFFTLTYIDDVDFPLPVWGMTLCFVAVGLLLYFGGLTNAIESHVPNETVLEPWGYTSAPGAFQTIVYAWFSIIGIAVLMLFISAYRREKNQKKKKQLRVFMIAIIQYQAIAVAIDLIAYSINPHLFPPMGFLYTTILCLAIGYGVLRYGMFQIGPAALAQPILQNLAEAVLGINPQLEIEFSNQGAETIFGVSQTRLKSARVQQLFDAPTYERIMESVKHGQRNFIIDDIQLHSAKHGHSIVQLYGNRIYDERKQYAGYIFVVQDLTELKNKTIELAHEKSNVERKVIERTRQLHEEQARLQAAIEDLALGFITLDDDNKIVIQNKALQRIFGLTDSVQSLSELNKYFEQFNLVKHIERVHKTKRLIEIKEVAVGEKIIHIYVSPVLTQGAKEEQVIGCVLMLEDITEVKVLERSRDEFFSIASHELRTPLTAIRGNASMALDYYPEAMKDEGIHQIIDDIHDSSVRLIEIVNDFLDMSRLEQGKVAFELGEHSVEEVIENIVYEMKAVVNEKHLALRFDKMQLDSLPKVWTDKNRLKQVLYNMIGNAVKFTDKGSVDISAAVENHQIKITITDTGRGISTESRKLLFHKFQQAGDSLLTRDTTRGTGLGLYISRMLAERMGGTLKLEHTEVDKGSVFSLTLPIATEELKSKDLHDGAPKIDSTTGLTIAPAPAPAS